MDVAEQYKERGKYDVVGNAMEPINEFVSENSVLGDKADAVTEGLGQVAGTIGVAALTGGLGAAPGVVTGVTSAVSGLSSMGSGITEAYNAGASDLEAWGYGTMKGVIDAGTELIFGGLGKATKAIGISKGIGGLDDMFAKKASSKLAGWIANPTVRTWIGNLIEANIKAGGEGFEEVLAGYCTAFAKKLTYLSDEDLGEIVENENLLDQFIIGFIVGEIAQSGDFVKSSSKGTDFVTGDTVNETNVIERVYNDAIAETETDGKKLTTREKNKIYNDVRNQIKQGEIYANTIKSILNINSIKNNITYKSDIRLAELGVSKSEIKFLSPVVAKAVFGEKLSIEEQSVLINSDVASQVVKELTQEARNIIWRDKKGVTSRGGVASFVSEDGSIKTIPQITEKDGIRTIDATTVMDEDAFIDGLWEGSRNTKNNENANNVERSQFETVDNYSYDWYNGDVITDGSHYIDGELKANVKYKSGEYDYIYSTDELGRIIGFVTKKLQFTKRNKRLKHNSNTYNKQKGDHAGHLIADRFGGSHELDNLVSQSAFVNLSEYKKMENIWAKALKNNQKVELDIQVRYEGNSKRPSAFEVKYTIDGRSFNRTINN